MHLEQVSIWAMGLIIEWKRCAVEFIYQLIGYRLCLYSKSRRFHDYATKKRFARRHRGGTSCCATANVEAQPPIAKAFHPDTDLFINNAPSRTIHRAGPMTAWRWASVLLSSTACTGVSRFTACKSNRYSRSRMIGLRDRREAELGVRSAAENYAGRRGALIPSEIFRSDIGVPEASLGGIPGCHRLEAGTTIWGV